MNTFSNLPTSEKLKPLVNTDIVVRGTTYHFSDMIDNEIVSDFPIYSHRIRSNFVKMCGIFDSFMTEINGRFTQLDSDLDNYLENKIQGIVKTIESALNEEKSKLEISISGTVEQLTSKVDTKIGEVDQKLSQVDSKISEIDTLKNNVSDEWSTTKSKADSKIQEMDNVIAGKIPVASDDQRGIISKNEIRKIAPTIAEATDSKLGLISFNKIYELLAEFGINKNITDDLNGKNINDRLPTGFYKTDEDRKIKGDNAVVFNKVYATSSENGWGMQLAITEADNPKMYFRSLRGNAGWKPWKQAITRDDIQLATIEDIVNAMRE